MQLSRRLLRSFPTSTPVVMTIYAPTPEPYVAPPGSMEEGIEEMYRCLQEHEEVRVVFALGMQQKGLSPEGAEGFLQAMLEDEEVFTEVILAAAESDPASASLLALLGDPAGELCGPVAEAPGRDLAAGDSELEVLLGELFECYHSVPEVRALIEVSLEGEAGAGFFGAVMSDRDLFVELALVGVHQDPDAAEELEYLEVALEALCR